MSTLAREQSTALHQAVQVAERIGLLPAVATQDWCERAGATLLPIIGSGVCVTMIGEVDDRGVIQRAEATGVAGAALAEIGTLVGRSSTVSTTTLPIDPTDPALARVRTSLDQARELAWSPGPIGGVSGMTGPVVGTPATLAQGPANQANLARRWEGVAHANLFLGAIAIGSGGRGLFVELASTNLGPGGITGEHELAILHAVLPLLAKRAAMAIGTGPAEAAHWLTAREQVILQHLLLGKSVREIAEELGRSPHTVHDHVKSLHRKLSASSRGELVARALGYVEIKPIGDLSAVDREV
jgi:DNA-binding CsgD family transcriptional regulator